MIKSPLTSPLRPALTSPYELITRSVFELNGTQGGDLRKLFVLNSSFEIEWKSQWPQGDSGGYFFANNNGSNGQSDRFVMSSDKKIFGAGFNGTQVIETAFADQSIHAFRLVSVLGGDVTFYVDNTIVASAPALFPVNINSIGDQYGSATSVTNYAGIFYDLKIWTNGDSNTGDLILNVPFDESDADYQRNRAFVGSFVDANRNWYYQGDLIGDSDLIEIDFSSGDSGPAATASGSVFDPGKSYEVIYDVLSLSAGGSVRLNHGSNGVQDEPYNDTAGIKTAYVIANGSGNGTMQFYALADTQAQIRIISIREWSGVILQSALPEDWMQIEKKRWWDYWLDSGVFGFAGFNSIDWSINLDGTASVTTTKQISGPSTIYSLEYPLIVGDIYEVSFESVDWVGDGRVGLSFESFGRPEGVSINDRSVAGNVKFSKELVATGTVLSLFRYVGSGVGSVRIKNLVIRRKLEIAQ